MASKGSQRARISRYATNPHPFVHWLICCSVAVICSGSHVQELQHALDIISLVLTHHGVFHFRQAQCSLVKADSPANKCYWTDARPEGEFTRKNAKEVRRFCLLLVYFASDHILTKHNLNCR